MELCSDGHNEVCYDSRECPACAEHNSLTEELDDLKRELADTEQKLAALEDE